MVRVLKSDGLAPASISDAAVAAMSTIEGVENPTIEDVDADSAIVSYDWTKGTQHFDRTDEHLARYGLRKDWTWNRDPLG